jgi:4-hydroxy-3-polyprenylbenzoate decarboxylase
LLRLRIVIGITGATGAIYGIRLLEALKNTDIETHLVLSKWARKTIELETEYTVDGVVNLADYFHHEDNLGASISSGSFKHQGMIIIPCSMKTLSAIAHGFNNNLIMRSADVTIKEQRKLILIPRETPLNPIHLENMLALARLGVVIMPPVPTFYHRPQKLEDIIEQTVGRTLDLLGIENNLVERWEA